MNDHFKHIYKHRAEDYERLIAREDYQGNIVKALMQLAPLADADIVEFGAGTGRLTRLLAPHVRKITAFDISPAMLSVARQIVSPYQNVMMAVSDNRQMPLPDNCAQITIEGWSFAHLRGWYPQTWQVEAGKAIAEMLRVTQPGGTVMMLETLGTGFLKPTPPTPELAEYYAWLEHNYGFIRNAVSMDFRFQDLDEAIELTSFFFGPELAEKARANAWVILPEWGGIWILNT